MDPAPNIRGIFFDPRLEGHTRLQETYTWLLRLLDTLSWKEGLPQDFPAIVAFIGGTGTGKSTLFNSLSGRVISDVGVKRPCTLQPVILVHEDALAELQTCPLLNMTEETRPRYSIHRDDALRQVILADTPDFDSIETANRKIAEDLFIISDIVVLITSQEKYGDLSGDRMRELAALWNKRALFVMNKVTSESAWEDFRNALDQGAIESEPIAVKRLSSAPDIIHGLRDLPGFSDLFSTDGSEKETKQTKRHEKAGLRKRLASGLQDFEELLRSRIERLENINTAINNIRESVYDEMERSLEIVVSSEMENRIRGRLQELLRKYDILFVPRMLIRKALRTAFRSITDVLSLTSPERNTDTNNGDAMAEDLHKMRSTAMLEPLERAVAQLNYRVSELLVSNPGLEDLREIVAADVPKWSSEEIRSKYEEAFPGVEHLLEEEFERLRHGLSTADEIKLYGSYTLWALVLITAEIVVGGGFTLLDALLNGVIMPFIPKWLLNLHVVDTLKEIGRRVDERNRKELRGILSSRADLYVNAFSGLLPARGSLESVRRLRESIAAS